MGERPERPAAAREEGGELAMDAHVGAAVVAMELVLREQRGEGMVVGVGHTVSVADGCVGISRRIVKKPCGGPHRRMARRAGRRRRRWCVLAALVVVAVVTVVARRAVASPLLGRLRALFPAWRFFDRATGSPALLVRFAAGTGELGPWSPAREDRGDGAARWLFAPRSNLALAYQSVVDQLVHDLGELEVDEQAGDGDGASEEVDPAVAGLVSYELVSRIARAHVPCGARFQWKVVVPGEPAPEDYVVSQVLAA